MLKYVALWSTWQYALFLQCMVLPLVSFITSGNEFRPPLATPKLLVASHCLTVGPSDYSCDPYASLFGFTAAPEPHATTK